MTTIQKTAHPSNNKKKYRTPTISKDQHTSKEENIEEDATQSSLLLDKKEAYTNIGDNEISLTSSASQSEYCTEIGSNQYSY